MNFKKKKLSSLSMNISWLEIFSNEVIVRNTKMKDEMRCRFSGKLFLDLADHQTLSILYKNERG